MDLTRERAWGQSSSAERCGEKTGEGKQGECGAGGGGGHGKLRQ